MAFLRHLPGRGGVVASLAAVSANSPTDAWAIGRDQVNTFEFLVSPTEMQNETYSLHWNGTKWRIVPMPLVGSSNVNNFFAFYAVKANSPTDVWAVGSQGVVDGGSSTLIEHFNGTSWSIVPSPPPGNNASLTGVTTSNAANNVWAVGYDTIPGTTTLRTLTLNWNGTAWVTVPSPNASVSSSVLNSVSTTPGAAIVQAVGDSGVYGANNPFALQNG